MFSKFLDSNDKQKAIGKYNLACNFKKEGDYDSAINLFKEAIELDPNYVDALNNLGNIYSAMENYDEAIYYLNRAFELNPDELIVLNNLGVCLMGLGKLDKAQMILEKSLIINPDFYHAYNNLGKLFTLKYELVKAKECFEKSLEMNPFDDRTRLRLESTKVLLNNLTEQEFKDIILKLEENLEDKDNIELLIKRAELYNLGKHFGEALFYYNKVLEISPNVIQALTGLSNIYLSIGDYYKSIEFAKKALEIDNQCKESYLHIGFANYYLGNFGISVESMLEFLSIAENDQDFFDGNYIIGLSYFQLENYNKSIYHLIKATELDNPSKGEAYFALANSYFTIGDEWNCLINMNKAIFLDNQNAIEWISRYHPDEEETWF